MRRLANRLSKHLSPGGSFDVSDVMKMEFDTSRCRVRRLFFSKSNSVDVWGELWLLALVDSAAF